MSTTVTKPSSRKMIEIDEDQVSYEIAIAKAQIHQVVDNLLNLVFTCGFLHCDNHMNRLTAFNSGLSAPTPFFSGTSDSL